MFDVLVYLYENYTALSACPDAEALTQRLADAGFDSERAHMFARQECGIRAIIPATRGRPTTKPLRGYWRNKMKQRFPKRQYGQRWQVETVHSMIKRVLGAALRARSYWSQSREIILKALTLNVMILRCGKVFDRAGYILSDGDSQLSPHWN